MVDTADRGDAMKAVNEWIAQPLFPTRAAWGRDRRALAAAEAAQAAFPQSTTVEPPGT